MAALFGHPWLSLQGPSPQDPDTGRLTVAGDTWAKALTGITAQQLARGLETCIAEGGEFAPSAPRFRAMCLGIPDFEAVNHELLCEVDARRSPFARLVWSHIDGYAHRRASADDAKRMRREAYAVAAEHVMRGGALPGEPAGEIEHQAQPKATGIPVTREARMKHLQGLLGELYNPVAAAREDRV